MTRHIRYMIEYDTVNDEPRHGWLGYSNHYLLEGTLKAWRTGLAHVSYRIYRRRFWFFWFLIAESPRGTKGVRHARGANSRQERAGTAAGA